MIAIIAGLLMILGAFFLMRGNVYLSVSTYIVVDVLWFLNAISDKNWFAVVTIFLGTAMSLYCFWKMHFNKYEKRIDKLE